MFVGRTEEREHIRMFIANNDTLLLITGNPGTGKTALVRLVLEEEKKAKNIKKYIFVNCMTDDLKFVDSFSKLKLKPLVVLDEYDSLKSNLRFTKLYTRLKGAKTIIIANKFVIPEKHINHCSILNFSTYDLETTKEIAECYVRENSIEISKTEIEFASRKSVQSGDLRVLFSILLLNTCANQEEYDLGLNEQLGTLVVAKRQGVTSVEFSKIMSRINKTSLKKNITRYECDELLSVLLAKGLVSRIIKREREWYYSTQNEIDLENTEKSVLRVFKDIDLL